MMNVRRISTVDTVAAESQSWIFRSQIEELEFWCMSNRWVSNWWYFLEFYYSPGLGGRSLSRPVALPRPDWSPGSPPGVSSFCRNGWLVSVLYSHCTWMWTVTVRCTIRVFERPIFWVLTRPTSTPMRRDISVLPFYWQKTKKPPVETQTFLFFEPSNIK